MVARGIGDAGADQAAALIVDHAVAADLDVSQRKLARVLDGTALARAWWLVAWLQRSMTHERMKLIVPVRPRSLPFIQFRLVLSAEFVAELVQGLAEGHLGTYGSRQKLTEFRAFAFNLFRAASFTAGRKLLARLFFQERTPAISHASVSFFGGYWASRRSAPPGISLAKVPIATYPSA